MRSFVFNLESVRRLRDHAERKAREDMARELGAREQHAAELARRTDAVEHAQDGARAAHPSARAMWHALIERRRVEQSRAVEQAREAELGEIATSAYVRKAGA